MNVRRSWAPGAIAAYGCLVAFTWCFEHGGAHAAQGFQKMNFSELERRPPGGPQQQASTKQTTYQKIDSSTDAYAIEYGFKNFNGDVLSIRTRLSSEVVADSIKEFGFRKSDFDKLDKWYRDARSLAIDQTNKTLKAGRFTSQAEADRASTLAQRSLDLELEMLAKSYRQRRVKIYEDAGFRMSGEQTVEADIPRMVQRNWQRIRPLAQSFSKIAADKGYEAEDLVGAVSAMVQTSMRYEIPDAAEGTRTIGGLLPPLKALVMGQGDCDTKTAVIGSILANWPNIKMVGLGIPGHYLMAYHHIPRRGDIFIEYNGLQYVMIESAGPAWLRPGTVGDSTLAYLKSGKNFRIQPM